MAKSRAPSKAALDTVLDTKGKHPITFEASGSRGPVVRMMTLGSLSNIILLTSLVNTVRV